MRGFQYRSRGGFGRGNVSRESFHKLYSTDLIPLASFLFSLTPGPRQCIFASHLHTKLILGTIPLPRRSSLRRGRIKLKRVLDLIILPHPNLPPLLRLLMLNPHLLGVRRDEVPDEARIPEFAGHPEVFAAAHEGVGFAAFDGGGDAFGGEVVLFAAGDGDESVCLVGLLVRCLYGDDWMVG